MPCYLILFSARITVGPPPILIVEEDKISCRCMGTPVRYKLLIGCINKFHISKWNLYRPEKRQAVTRHHTPREVIWYLMGSFIRIFHAGVNIPWKALSAHSFRGINCAVEGHVEKLQPRFRAIWWHHGRKQNGGFRNIAFFHYFI